MHTPRVVRTTRLAAAEEGAEAGVSEWAGDSRAEQAMPLDDEETDGRGTTRMLLLLLLLLLLWSHVEAKVEPSAQTT